MLFTLGKMIFLFKAMAVWVPQEADPKLRLDGKEIYWGEIAVKY
jgi:hypothetical protein